MALEEWKLRLTQPKLKLRLRVEVEAELGKIKMIFKANKWEFFYQKVAEQFE